MPRGRHRHSPPLHRLLPPSAIAGVSLVCAAGPWLFTEPTVLRALAAAAAVTAVVGGVVMRRWDTAAGKRVADLTRARASDEWRHEERVAELETDLDESRELRTKLEHKLRAKRAELAGLRNEHAALLRRYATAETERASALEGRRLLEIETVAPARALTAATETVESAESVDAVDSAEPEALEDVAATDEDMNEGTGGDTDDGVTVGDVTTVEAESASEEPTDAPESPQVFSPAGSSLFLRADAALSRITHGDAANNVSDADAEPGTDPDTDPDDDAKPGAESEAEVDTEADSEAEVETGTASDSEADAAASGSDEREPSEGESAEGGAAEGGPAKGGPAKGESDKGEPPTDGPPKGNRPLTDAKAAALPVPAARAASVEAEPAAPAAHPVKPTKPARASGHFTVPTAVAVAPAAPVRRPSVEGGFDFFGTQKGASSAAMDAMQNEDLADVVGQEALALHKAEAESGFKPVDEGSRGVGQVIDLTAHDETEHIDLTELRTAAS
ncbi:MULTISPECIES: hypothetical protein [unclassified Streptomyces]|uniref:hypothetical protein n=1 Tax=unclassified Streptomyces TaxID=2593676 RepID=UPI001162DF4E|nr:MULTISPECIES: hypothetical protein [unclassified Streptomyces]NMI59997.1 hypothetical protein [Streptomyces sp. RLA2-12]QDN59205.1 hypothetical protein FNV67_31470 [Streptomyces sp. S1D4-20]QDN69281.1 hypothetical protein FNV66_30490 [Streptomyces sp. S1D4-14]QDO51771.1 hypothetical protein FNV60_29185 [Streptomyces sp. RLB3-5]QDO62013.1 hypothetical protein FNV59_31430 [Streptomyces sp. RLB1-8]